MKTLILVRHAKAEKEIPGQADFDRQLTERGVSDASQMAQRTGIRDFGIQLILTSPAHRTSQTTGIMANYIGMLPENIISDKRIYQASADTLLDLLLELPDAFDKVMLVGHNPGIANLVGFFSRQIPGKIPTCTMAGFHIPSDEWVNITQVRPEQFLFAYPKLPY